MSQNPSSADQATLVVSQYQQWLADAQLENANLRAQNHLLTEALNEKNDPNA